MNNTFSADSSQLLRIFSNSLNSLDSVSSAINSSADNVVLRIFNEDGSTSSINVPTFGNIKANLERLDNNLRALTALDENSTSSVRLADGTFRKIFISKLLQEARDLSSVETISQFSVKSNWFFENLINPLLYVSINLGNQVSSSIQKSIVRRYILNLDSPLKRSIFSENFDSNSNIDFFQFLDIINTNSIQFILDEEVVDIPPRKKIYSGNFDVISSNLVDFKRTVNGESFTEQLLEFTLNKTTYSDSRSPILDTMGLKVNDFVTTVEEFPSKYKILSIDTERNSVILQRIEGNSVIRIGVNSLKFYSEEEISPRIDISIGNNEYCVVFIKPIDPDSNIPAINWSPGTGFYTSNLVLSSSTDEVSLSEYYKDRAVDFGAFVSALTQDKYPTVMQGLTPNTPTLVQDDLKVVLINKQLIESRRVEEIKTLNSRKENILSEISVLDSSIDSKRATISTKTYKNNIELNADKNDLNNLITERTKLYELYTSLVNQIQTSLVEGDLIDAKPKYRVRGFVPLPTPRFTEETGNQEIIRFITEYRYLNNDGVANAVDILKYTDTSAPTEGAFSNWIKSEGVLRKRSYDSLSGRWFWAPIDNKNSEVIDINQIDVPIQKGERVEIRVKVLSEAGYPYNPLESEYSDSVIVTFPDELSSESPVSSIVLSNQNSLAKISINEELSTKGILEHISTAFTQNGKYFAHDPDQIFSGFVSADQNPISLRNKLIELDTKLNQALLQLSNARGQIKVTLISEDGSEVDIPNGNLLNVFAGFYTEEVASLSIKKGVIVNKSYFINIQNTNQTVLELISRISGSTDRRVIESEDPSTSSSPSTILPAIYQFNDNYNTYRSSDSDYNSTLKYDIAPILLTNPSSDSNKFKEISNNPPYQSSQVKGQFIYVRSKDIAAEDNFFEYIFTDENGNETSINKLDDAENYYSRNIQLSDVSTSGEFIFGGKFYRDTGGKYFPTTTSDYENSDDDCIDVHINHPYLSRLNAFRNAYVNETSDTTTILNESFLTSSTVLWNIASTAAGVNETARRIAPLIFRHSKFMSLSQQTLAGKKQCMFIYEKVDSMGTSQSYGIARSTSFTQAFCGYATDILSSLDYKRAAKASFAQFDQYLLGKKSCGAYLFLSTEDHSKLIVDGRSKNSKRQVQFGSTFSIRIPLVFQYRMTDYWGEGNSGLGNIAGDKSGSITNLTYAKRIGIDIYIKDEDPYSFDLEFSAKYKSDSISIKSVPQINVQKSIEDVNSTIKAISSSIPQNS
mgnify:CR=1 FL=1